MLKVEIWNEPGKWGFWATSIFFMEAEPIVLLLNVYIDTHVERDMKQIAKLVPQSCGSKKFESFL